MKARFPLLEHCPALIIYNMRYGTNLSISLLRLNEAEELDRQANEHLRNNFFLLNYNIFTIFLFPS